MKIIKSGKHYKGTCLVCGCEVEAPKIEVKVKVVSHLYPADSIGFLGDKHKKCVSYVSCPECGNDLNVNL